MLTIGEFSKICLVTTKALRYYDEIGLIKPKCIGDNGYRYYATSQLRTMLLINRLKRYRFPLEDIARMLEDNSYEMMLNMLEAKFTELSAEHSRLEEFLGELRLDMDRLKKGVNIMSYMDETEIKLVERQPENILYTRQRMALTEYDKYYCKLFEIAAKGKYTIAGVPMAIYHDQEFSPESNDTELAVAVKESTNETRTLGGGLCAMAVHKGAYSGLSGTYAKLSEWLDTNGYTFSAPPYELYTVMADEKTSEANQLTEIYCPIKQSTPRT